ncbi:GTP-binding protein gtr2 [Coemansia sp. BCRC 34301]|nr:GTP-binding protein gtr2 [Coemansia sp. BCRC 34301]
MHDGLVETGLTTETGSAADITQSKGEEPLGERRVLMMGVPRSGKTSILSVIFEEMAPYDTMGMLPSQQRMSYHLVTGVMIYDFPGIDDYSETQYNTLSPSVYEGEYTSLVYVIDSQGDVQASLSTLFSIMRTAQSVNADIPINIFIHKVDWVSEELKMDIFQDIQNRVMKNMSYEFLNSTFVTFFLTSIFDESVREALSRVVRRLVPNYSSLETILNSFCSKSSLDKVFLFDVSTKIYLATDSSPTEGQMYMFGCQTLDVIEDIAYATTMPPSDEDATMQRAVVGMESNSKIFTYQVNSYLTLLCFGSLQVDRQESLLEFNGSKVAKAIRQVLTFSPAF